MNERIKEIFKRAGGKTSVRNLMSNPVQVVETHELWDDRIDKFAELIVKSILDRLETEREYYANPDTYQFLEYYTKMSAKEDALRDAISMIRSDFGVEE